MAHWIRPSVGEYPAVAIGGKASNKNLQKQHPICSPSTTNVPLAFWIVAKHNNTLLLFLQQCLIYYIWSMLSCRSAAIGPICQRSCNKEGEKGINEGLFLDTSMRVDLCSKCGWCHYKTHFEIERSIHDRFLRWVLPLFFEMDRKGRHQKLWLSICKTQRQDLVSFSSLIWHMTSAFWPDGTTSYLRWLTLVRHSEVYSFPTGRFSW